ncbi:MAG: RidA family protein [Clostridiales bacterium]|nr:RidA family protein [Clostridiales bacterium]
MSKLTRINSADAPAAIGPYSQAIVAGGFLFASGQIPVNPKTGNVDSDDVTAQAHVVLKNAGAVLKEAGLSYSDVVKTTVFITDMKDFAAVNAVYAEYFSEPYPARSCVQVVALPKGVKVEAEFIAKLN